MSIADYTALQARVARWSGGSSDANFAEAVREAIEMAEIDMDRMLWVKERIVRRIATFTAEYESLPEDCARIISIKRIEDGAEVDQLRKAHPDAAPGLARAYSGNRPLFYTETGAQLQLIPAPTVGDPLKARWIYYGFVPRLSDDTSCTAVLSTYPNVYLYTSLKHLAPFTDDPEGVAKWGALSAEAIQTANGAATKRSAA